MLGFVDEVMAYQFSTALVWYMTQPAFTNLEKTSFRMGRSCPAPTESSTARVSFRSMRGMFLTCGLCAGAAVLCAIGLHARGHTRRPVQAVEVGEKVTRAEAAAAEVV